MTGRFYKSERGSASVETALFLSIFVAIVLIFADFYLVARARTDLERITNTISSTLSSQVELTSNGFNYLVEGVLSGVSGEYQIFVGQINSNRDVKWSLATGNGEELCENPLENTPFQEALPEDEEGEDADKVAMIYVQACQRTESLNLTSLVLSNDVLRSITINRMRTADLEMDEDLRQRAGLPEEDEEEE
ncbi:TadE/TadG family type IV pilus assembly protein [Terasakiella pusilla]|uniref:TadE/TadG family type IV pilus assembly protein n=1 Tax=Terasakiella pusilla TaxID=64973 RepID=UPI003AA7EB80